MTRRLLLSAFCWAVLAAATVVQAAGPRAVVSGPLQASVGDLIVIDGSKSENATDYAWTLAGTQKTFLAVNGNTQIVFASGSPGFYEFVLAVAGQGDNGKPAVSIARFIVRVGEPPPTPTPPVPPVPPGPGPIPPTPTPAPIPEPGLHVLMVYESGTPLTSGQQGVIYGKAIRDYLNAKCVPDPKVSGWKAFRIYDKDIDLSAESPVWQTAMKRPRTALPWIIISDPAKGGYEGPLPVSVEDTLALLKKYGGE